jgi:hypothetical protein
MMASRSLWCSLLLLATVVAIPVRTALAQSLATIEVTATTRASQHNVPVTIGQAFAAGKVAAGSTIAVLDSRKRRLPAQLDWKASHADGSLRHGVLTFVLPNVEANGAESLQLVATPVHAERERTSLADVLATEFDASVKLKVEDRTYVARLRPAIGAGRVEQWLGGELVSEWIIQSDFEDDKGLRHPYLLGEFHVRAYKQGGRVSRVRLDVVVENSWARADGIGNQLYDVSIQVASRQVFERKAVNHFSFSRWHRVFWWGEEPGVYARLDTQQLQDSKAAPQYAHLSPDEKTLESLPQEPPAPMDNLDLDDKLGQGGARPWIGPMTRWDSLYLVSADVRAWRAMLAYNDAWSAYPIHYRDEKTGLPVDLSLPRNHLGGVAGAGKADFARPTSRGPYVWKNSHAPPAGYMAYLVTGDRYYLDELLFAANINLLQEITVGSRAYPSTWPRVLHSRQVRAQAWGLRTLGLAAYLTPDSHPLKKYFERSVEDNLRYYNSVYPRDNPLGLISRERGRYTYDTLGPDTGYSPWQHNFFTFSVGRLVELGFDEARPLFSFVTRWHRGVLVNPEFCWVFAVNYSMGVRPAKDLPVFSSYKEVYEANVPPEIRALGCGSAEMASAIGKPEGAFNDFQNSPTSYQANQQPAVAMMATLSEAGGQEAWKLVSSRKGRPKYDNYPNFAVIPRSPAPQAGPWRRAGEFVLLKQDQSGTDQPTGL